MTDSVRELSQRLSNWGRWGEEDERGTVNLLTPERIVAAAQLVTRGVVFELGIPLDQHGPQPGGARTNPIHLMSRTGHEEEFAGGFRYSDDLVFMPLQAGSQWDALAHVYYDDHLYNGHPATEVSALGAQRCGIDKLGPGVVGRGVLVDLPRLKDVPWLERGEPVHPSDLDAALERQGVEIRAGDVLLVRTGWRRFFVERQSARAFMSGEPGLSLACAEWLHEREIAVLASDNWAIEVIPGEDPDVVMPLHMVLIRDMGMTLGEIFDLEALADDCALDGRYEFMFCGPTLRVTGGVGSPVNALALK